MLLLMLSNGGSSVSRLLERVPCICRWQSLLEEWWQAASEVAPATLSMVLRTIPTAKTAAEAAERVRGAWLWAIEDHHRAHSNGLGVSAILDVGCSTGESTQALAAGFPDAKLVVGL
jgi:2-polyprenyl-3-methyl-5-hydroxy-6-metoxy-1,4-benzoquinol methylase